MFGYRNHSNLSHGAAGNRIITGSKFSWSATITMGSVEPKDQIFCHGYSTSTVRGGGAIGSITDSTIDGMWDDDSGHEDNDAGIAPNYSSNRVTLIECCWCIDGASTGDPQFITVKFAGGAGGANNQHSNCVEMNGIGSSTGGGGLGGAAFDTITINGVDFHMGLPGHAMGQPGYDAPYAFGAVDVEDRYTWIEGGPYTNSNISNPFGALSGDFVVTISSGGLMDRRWSPFTDDHPT